MRGGGRYLRVMGTLWRHRKAEAAGDAALGLLLRIWSYCADQGDAFVSRRAMAMLLAHDRNGPRKLRALVTSGLLDETTDGWLPHDWEEWQDERRPAIQRAVVLDRDGWRCRYCEADLRVVVAHVDHVIPFSRGGSSSLNNLVAACAQCNTRKGARTPEEWLS